MVSNILLSAFRVKSLELIFAQKYIIMKLIKYGLTLILSFFIFACSSDDNEPQPLSQNDIQGEWFLTELNASRPVDLNNDGNSSTELTQETTCFDDMKIVFNDNAYTFTYPKLDFNGASNENLSCLNAINTGIYTLEQNILTATTTIDGTENIESVNVELANNQLRFTITSSQVSNYLDLGESTNSNSDLEFLEFVFTK